MSEQIGILDANIIIKTCREGSNFFDDIISLFDQCYLHNTVYAEVKFPEDSLKKLNDFIRQDKVVLIEDETLLKEATSKKFFLKTLREACNIFNTIYYDKYYSKLQEINKRDFLPKLLEIDKNKVFKNTGEIRTLQMIILLRDTSKFNDKINVFLTDDNGARINLVRKYGKTIKESLTLKGLSTLGCLFLLKDKISKAKAIKYINILPEDKTKIVSLKEKKKILVKNEEIINEIFSGKIKVNEFGDLVLLNF